MYLQVRNDRLFRQSWSLVLLVAEVPPNVFINLEAIHKPGLCDFHLDLEDVDPGMVIFLYLGFSFQDILLSKSPLYHMDNNIQKSPVSSQKVMEYINIT